MEKEGLNMKRTKTVFGAEFIGVFAVFIVILISAFATLAQAEDFAACLPRPGAMQARKCKG